MCRPCGRSCRSRLQNGVSAHGLKLSYWSTTTRAVLDMWPAGVSIWICVLTSLFAGSKSCSPRRKHLTSVRRSLQPRRPTCKKGGPGAYGVLGAALAVCRSPPWQSSKAIAASRPFGTFKPSHILPPHLQTDTHTDTLLLLRFESLSFKA